MRLDLVTGRFVTRNVTQVTRVLFADGTELSGTQQHPIWSEDRQAWVKLGELASGEQVRSRAGLLAVLQVDIAVDPQPVYNLEVFGEHVYEVGDAGILIHNAVPVDCKEAWEHFQKLQKLTSHTTEQLDDLAKLEKRFPDGKFVESVAPNRLHRPSDLERISRIRSDLGVGKGRNIAFGEGHINGKDFGEVLGVSGRNTPGVQMHSQRIFRTGVDEFDRAFDGEVFVLENFARRLKPTDSGTIRLVSERTFCDSCSDVITQFRQRFPNIRLILVDGTP